MASFTLPVFSSKYLDTQVLPIKIIKKTVLFERPELYYSLPFIQVLIFYIFINIQRVFTSQ